MVYWLAGWLAWDTGYFIILYSYIPGVYKSHSFYIRDGIENTLKNISRYLRIMNCEVFYFIFNSTSISISVIDFFGISRSLMSGMVCMEFGIWDRIVLFVYLFVCLDGLV